MNKIFKIFDVPAIVLHMDFNPESKSTWGKYKYKVFLRGEIKTCIGTESKINFVFHHITIL